MTKIKTPEQMTKEELANYNRPFNHRVVGSKKVAKWNRHKQDTLQTDRSAAQARLRT
jgi:hypothetical protein